LTRSASRSPFSRWAAKRKFLAANKFDLINAHYAPQHAAIAAELGIPFVQTVHSTYVGLDRRQLALHRAADPHTCAYFCVSNAAAGYADVRLGCGVERMVIVPNGVDAEALDAAEARLDRAAERRALGLSDQDFVFLHVGSIYPPKGHHLLIEALHAVRRRDPRVKVAFLGRVMDEAYAFRVREQAARLGLADALHWLGYQIDPQRFYYLCDGFVLPSFIEGWSLALGEALYARLPVVATDVGGAREIVPRAGGRLLAPPYGSILDLDAAALYKLLDQPHAAFVAELASAMTAVAEDPQPAVLSDQLARSLDRRQAYAAYGLLFEWIAAGGHPAAARPWVRGLHADRSADARELAPHQVVLAST
jgi:glycosyltransferase involved in cell wall biosynthesis